MLPYSSRTFQRYQEYDMMHCDFKDFNTINKTNNVTSFINIYFPSQDLGSLIEIIFEDLNISENYIS
jgi:hypothetical protein